MSSWNNSCILTFGSSASVVVRKLINFDIIETLGIENYQRGILSE